MSPSVHISHRRQWKVLVTFIVSSLLAGCTDNPPVAPSIPDRAIQHPSVLRDALAGTVLFSQGPRNSNEGASLRSNLLLGAGTAETEQQIADNFTLADAAIVGHVSWEGFYFQTPLPAVPTVSFVIRIYSDLSSTPLVDAQVAASYEQVGVGNFGSPLYRFAADLPAPLAVNGGSRYWLAVLENDPATAIDFRWWNTTLEKWEDAVPGVDLNAWRSGPSVQWFVQDPHPMPDFTFELSTGVAPTPQLEGVGDAILWMGLKNSDAVGLRADLRVEVLVDNVVIAAGELSNVATGSSGFNNARLNTIASGLLDGSVDLPEGATISLRPSVRRTCSGTGHKSGTIRFWYNGAPTDSGPGRDAGSRFTIVVDGNPVTLFARTPAELAVDAGSERTYVDVSINSSIPCPDRPFTVIGTWSGIAP